MRAKFINRGFRCVALAASITVAGSALPSALSAQATLDTSTTGSMAQTSRTDMNANTNDDDDTNWGWLGLLGLAGLLGLRKRDEHVHHTDTTTRRP